MPAAVRIVWPTAPTITTPARYNEVASTAMRLLADASTALARIKSKSAALTGAVGRKPVGFTTPNTERKGTQIDIGS